MLPHLLFRLVPNIWLGEAQGALFTLLVEQGATAAPEVHTIAAAGQREAARTTSRPPLDSAIKANRVSAPWGAEIRQFAPSKGLRNGNRMASHTPSGMTLC
ncbi:hypothetical protein C8R46DRAFT_1355069, partial [Mycena filopes]